MGMKVLAHLEYHPDCDAHGDAGHEALPSSYVCVCGATQAWHKAWTTDLVTEIVGYMIRTGSLSEKDTIGELLAHLRIRQIREEKGR